MKHLFSFIISLSFALGAMANSNFIKELDVVSANHRAFVRATADGGYLITTTHTLSTDTGDAQAFKLLKYDACDKLLWDKDYITNRENLAVIDVHITNDNNILITGYAKKGFFYAAYVLKISPSGDMVFNKLIKSSKNVYGYGIGELANGDYFLYGNAVEGVPEDFWNFVLKMDKDGNTLSNTSYFNIAIWGKAIATSDGGVLANTGDNIFKMDQSGAIQWAQEVSGFSYYNSQPIEVEDGYVYCRYSHSFTRTHSAFLFKVGFNGDLLWTGEGFEGTEANRFIKLPNDHFLVSTDLFIDSATTQIPHVLYTELDGTGQIVKQYLQKNTGFNGHFNGGLTLTSNNEVIHLGTNRNNNIMGFGDIVLSKMDYQGELKGCELEKVSYEAVSEITTMLQKSVTPHSQSLTELIFDIKEVDGSHFEKELCYIEEELSLDLGSDTVLCPTEVLSIGSSETFQSYNWNTGSTQPFISVSEAGTYILTVGDGCEFISDTIKVTYYPELDYEFSVSPLYPTPLIPVNFYTNLDSSFAKSWSFDGEWNDEKSFEHYFADNGRYPIYLSFEDKNGCSYRDSATVVVDYFKYYLPNAFTPNGDGINDVFLPVGFGIASFELKIFNRWGEMIFEGEDEGWDGSEAQVDTYVYQITIHRESATKEEERGLIQLIR